MKVVDKVGNVANCSGCGLCESLCPKDAVEMRWSSVGFLEPFIHVDKCVNCGLCLRKCPQVKPLERHADSFAVRVYGAWNKDRSIHESSSSGGVFMALAEHILEQGGIVFGVVWRDKSTPVFSKATTVSELRNMQGSKYAQAVPDWVYRDVRLQLKLGKWVLFVGTPCQVHALKVYLGRLPENLITVDIVCHGIPSRILLEKYICEYEALSRREISRISFREKPEGWRRFHVARYYSDGSRESSPLDEDVYMRLFLSDKALKDACYNCAYAACPRPGDITLGDFWGVENYHSAWPIDAGISAVLASSQKGEDLLHLLVTDDRIELHPAQLSEMMDFQGGFKPVRPIPADRPMFMADLPRLRLRKLVRRYLDCVRIGPFYVVRCGWIHCRADAIHRFWQRCVGFVKIKLGLIKTS